MVQRLASAGTELDFSWMTFYGGYNSTRNFDGTTVSAAEMLMMRTKMMYSSSLVLPSVSDCRVGVLAEFLDLRGTSKPSAHAALTLMTVLIFSFKKPLCRCRNPTKSSME